MKAAILHQVGDTTLDVRDDVASTPVGAGKVRIRLRATGVCHSDLSAMTGTIPVAVPAVLGHEGAGEVVEVGAGVTGLAEGDHVVVCWSPQCGACKDCVNGQPQLCMAYMLNAFSDAHFMIGTTPVFGMAGAGTFAEELIVLEQGAIKIDKDVPLDVASLRQEWTAIKEEARQLQPSALPSPEMVTVTAITMDTMIIAIARAVITMIITAE